MVKNNLYILLFLLLIILILIICSIIIQDICYKEGRGTIVGKSARGGGEEYYYVQKIKNDKNLEQYNSNLKSYFCRQICSFLN